MVLQKLTPRIIALGGALLGLVAMPSAHAQFQIAYHAQDSSNIEQIFFLPATGGLPTQVTSGTTRKFHPTWSPDGTKIAYEATGTSGVFQIWTVPVTGGPPTQITTNAIDKSYPTWSPDGTKIAFSGSDPKNQSAQLYTVPANGGTATQITFGIDSKYQPAWSPNGAQIAYIGFDASFTVLQIFTVPSKGGVGTQITRGIDSKVRPTWSPDSSQIAYSSFDPTGQFFQIWKIPAVGGTATQLTTGNAFKYEPSWSPEGTKIAYTALNGGALELFSVPSTGGAQTKIAGGAPNKFAVAWSPVPFSGLPTVNALSPSRIVAGGAPLDVIVIGSKFNNRSQVKFGTASVPTTFISATRVKATIPSELLKTVGFVDVSVVNAPPGGGNSNSKPFLLANPNPRIGRLTPSIVVPKSPDTPVTITGTGFFPESQVTFGLVDLPVTYVSAKELKVTVPASLLVSPTVYGVRVTSPLTITSSNVTNFTIIDNTKVELVATPAPVITKNGTTLSVTVTFKNIGSATALGVRVVGGKLNTTATTGVTPALGKDIDPGASVSYTLTFPVAAAASGTKPTIRLAYGSVNAGSGYPTAVCDTVP